MRIQYLGTGAAEGFPAAFCNCMHCSAARKDPEREWRTRSQALIDGKLLVDFPPESYLHAVRYGVDLSAVRALLVTHSHTDHFYAQEFVNRGYKFASGMTSPILDIYGDETVREVYEEGTRREIKPEVLSGIRFRVVQPFGHFEADGYEIFSLPATHTKEERSLLYCIRREGKTLLYLNDTGLLREECYAFLAGNGIRADFVSLDCTFADDPSPHSPRHMGFAENETVRGRLADYGIVHGGTQYCVTHFSHNSAPFRKRIEEEAKKRGFLAAYDGALFEF